MPTPSHRPVAQRLAVPGRALAVLVALACGAVTGTAPAGATPSAGTPEAASASDPVLKAQLARVLKDPRVTAGTTAAVVLDAGDGKIIFGRSPSRALTPASNTKLLTAAAAMATLGPGYRFRTQVIRRSPVTAGVIKGDLYLKGWGDPTSREADYASLANQLRQRGVRKITGRLVVDATFFDADRYNDHWSSGYFNDYYAAQVSALTVAPDDDLDSGTVILRVSPAKKGRKATVTVLPASARGYVKITNNTSTTSSGSTTIKARRAAGGNHYTVRGSIRTGAKPINELRTVDRPDLYAAAVFRAQLGKAGIMVGGRTVTGRTPTNGGR